MDIEKKDWENIKKEADAQIKQATIMLIVNQHIYDIAEKNINAMLYAESSKQATIDNTHST